MEIYESLQRLIDLTSFSPDTILLLFANVVLVYEVCVAVTYGVVIFAVLKLLAWFDALLKQNKP